MKHLHSYKLFEAVELSSKLTVPKDTHLFHSTGEDFEPDKLRGGGYDSVIWTTEDSAISQTYIPQSGSTIYTSASNIAEPSDNQVIQSLQHQIGIKYDYDDIKWENRKPVSWWTPKVFTKWDKLGWAERNTNKLKYINDQLKKVLGYSIYQEDSGLNHGYAIKSDGNKAVSADFMMKGRLFVIIPREDLKIYDMTYGGKVEGDLQDLDYNKVNFFEKLGDDGFDGVKINDYAQTKEFGNFGHTSIGLFEAGIKKCDWEVIPDVTYPKDFEELANNRDWDSTEYKAYKKLITIEESEQPIKDLEVYHGSDVKFDEFDFDKTAQGVIWFSDNIEAIKSGEAGADGAEHILTRKITLNNPAGWDEYEKKSFAELIGDGYDGVILDQGDSINYIVFEPESISESLLEGNEFDKWFKGSKIVDSKGNPLVVYHGSQTELTEFYDGTYFTPDFYNAEGYAGGEYVYEAYLSIKKPLVIDAHGKKWDAIDTPHGTSTQEVVSNLSTQYDGVIFNNIKDSWIDDTDYQDPATIYYCVKASQIKSTEFIKE